VHNKSTKYTLETNMTVLKGLVLIAIASCGVLAAYAGADSPPAASAIGFYPNVSLPTLFQPMSR
jgi:hypothetical protein